MQGGGSSSLAAEAAPGSTAESGFLTGQSFSLAVHCPALSEDRRSKETLFRY